ncbi:hypothetical protein ACU5AX_05425 [Sphingomonas sp. XXL09]|uniref:hypothetical protein n=1 Tax=Sphingomonas sp. XXL09 TaxID=3457787 RepID=UPI00406BA2CE
MSFLGETMTALRNVLLLQEDVRQLKDMATSQSGRLAALAEAHAALRDRVSRLEGVIEGAAMATRQRRIED